MKRYFFVASLGWLLLPGGFAASPTDGFVQVPYFFYIQHPYALALEERYVATNGTHHFWVYRNDLPFQPGSATAPRTEMRIWNDYTNGVWQFEGDLYIPSGTTGAAVMQVFGGATQSTSCQLRIYGGTLCRYTTPLRTNLYDSWTRVNVIHDADAHLVSIYLNGTLLRSDPDRGPSSYYFKCGVYAQDNPSERMEAFWANIKVWRRLPRIGEITKHGNGWLVAATNGSPGRACLLLSSTDAAAPLSQWQRLATNYFDAQGSFLFTNLNGDASAQRFFSLQFP